jgi:hypothetical protein
MEFVNVEPEKIAAELSKRGMAWADADAAKRALDNASKAILAEIKTRSEGSSDAARETNALASPEYRAHLDALTGAIKAANRALVSYETYKTFVELTRSKVATERAAMNLR